MSLQPNEAPLPEVRGADAAATRQAANDQRVELARRQMAVQADIESAKADLERQRSAMEAAFRKQMADLEAQSAPLKAELARMAEVLHTVDLYLGRSEEMELLRGGEPADVDEPIVVRQRVLAADEESLVLIEDGGVDARRMDAFFEWIAASVDNTARLLPEPKCVVAVVPTRQERDYGDPWTNAAVGAANAQTHWLFRNGEQLWVMTTDFNAGATITPRLDEFTAFFQAKDWRGDPTGDTLVPGSDKWLDAERHADARKRHFMKVGMILQGVLDRTEVFTPLPEGGVNILTAAQAELGQVRFINELDMVLTDGRESFREWQARLNSQLRPGLRVVGAFKRVGVDGGFGGEYVKAETWRRGYHPRLHPGSAEYPVTGEVYPIKGRNSGGELIIRYARTEKIERRNVPVPGEPGYVYPWAMVEPRNRASCIVRAGDAWILPYDLASIDDLTYYLNHREARKSYQAMVPVLKAAIAAKLVEREAEAPFRALLAGDLARRHGMGVEAVEALLPDVVDRWKLGHRHHRALTGDAAHEGKALRGVRAEFAATINAQTAGLRPAVEQAARNQFGARLLAILGKRDGTFLAVARSTGAPNPFGLGWVDVMTITKTGITKPVTEWTTVAPRTLATTETAWAHDDWATWTMPEAPVRLTGPELDVLATQLRDEAIADHPGHRVVAVVQALDVDWPRKPSKVLTVILHESGEAKPSKLSTVWQRKDGHAVLGPVRRDYGSGGYGGTVTVDGVQYAGEGSFPWVGEGNSYFGDVSRPRLVWLDPDVFRSWMVDVDAKQAAVKAEREVNEARWVAFHRWKRVHEAALEEHLRAKVHDRFVAEYGTGADDLFEPYLAKQKLDPARAAANQEVTPDWDRIAGQTVSDVATADVPRIVAAYRYPAAEAGQ